MLSASSKAQHIDYLKRKNKFQPCHLVVNNTAVLSLWPDKTLLCRHRFNCNFPLEPLEFPIIFSHEEICEHHLPWLGELCSVHSAIKKIKPEENSARCVVPHCRCHVPLADSKMSQMTSSAAAVEKPWFLVLRLHL